MVDMNALERQLADESLRIVGPEPIVDDAAIFTAITATQSPKWRFQSVFNAAKFVVAGAIVALFGGFLLTGLLAQQPSQEPLPPAAASASASPEANATWTPPPELALEGIAPGVTKATLTGVGLEPDDGPYDFTFDRGGDMWLLSPGGLLRVGDDTAYPSPGSSDNFWDLSPAPDGTLWALANDTVASFRDGDWTEAPPFPGNAPAQALEVLPDGTVWARSRTRLARLDGDAWTAYRYTDDQGPVRDAGYVSPWDLAWTPDGSLWVTTCNKKVNEAWEPGPVGPPLLTGGFLRFDGEAFHQVVLPVPVQGCIGPLVSGPDGELWAFLDADPPTLARFDGTDWEPSDDGVGVPRIQWSGYLVGTMVAAPDGRLWAIGYTGIYPGGGRVFGAYDGTTWTVVDALDQYLAHDDAPYHVAPDGSLWLGPLNGEVLIVTPEALATAELPAE